MQEIWKDVVGYEGLYQVSNLGTIRSLPKLLICKDGKRKHLSAKSLSPSIGSHGYRALTLCKDGLHKGETVHALVASAFILNPDNKQYINHKDGNKLNNKLTNLEWCTHQENMQHAHNTKLIKAFSKPIMQIDLNGKIVKTYNSTLDAEKETGIRNQHISAVALGKPKFKSAGGFRWQYVS